MKRVLLIPALVLLFLSLAGYFWSAGVLAGKKPIVVASADEVKTLDMGRTSWATDLRVGEALWEGLLIRDPVTQRPVPGVAERFDLSADGKVYTFHLRHDAAWSNGEPVTSRDFIFSWKRVLTPATGSEYIGFMYSIVGAQAYSDALTAKKPADFASVGIKAPDDFTLVVQLNEPVAYFPDLVAFPTFSPMNEKAMASDLVNPNDPSQGYKGMWIRPPAIVSNGPFMLKEWRFKEYMLLVPNPHYWNRPSVKCDQLVLKTISDPRAALLALQSDAVDALTFAPDSFAPELREQQDAGKRRDFHYIPVFGTYYFEFNCGRAPFDDPRIRRALAMSVDCKKIVHDVTRMNQLTDGLLVPHDTIPGYTSPAGTPYDVPQAKQLLADAGHPNGEGLRSIEILYSTEGAIHGRIAQAIGEMWEHDLGLKVTYRGLEKGSFSSERQETHNFDVARAGWYGDYLDPTTWLDLAKSDNGNNNTRFADRHYDGLLDRAAKEIDSAKRLAILTEAEGYLTQQAQPFIPIFRYANGVMVDEEKIGGFALNSRGSCPLNSIYRK